jgi:hypothetical protein
MLILQSVAGVNWRSPFETHPFGGVYPVEGCVIVGRMPSHKAREFSASVRDVI